MNSTMNSTMRRLFLILLFAVLLPFDPARAGNACNEQKTDAGNFVKAMKLAEDTRAALEKSGAEVAMITRVGQDLSQYGQRYSHMAWVWRDHPKGRWTVVHELNQCGTASSAIYDQGLANFFMDDLFEYEARILVPGAASQARIVAMLGSSTPRRLHSARYNMLAYAYSTAYQNSNQWVLETYAAAQSEFQVDQRGRAQAWLKLAGYRPITVYVNATTRLGARLFKANVSFDDHPFGRRMAGQIDTVTVDSVLQFVRQRDREVREMVLALN